jgi:hypothetical protein
MVAPRWKTPPFSFTEEATRDFRSRIGNAHSIIREYRSSPESFFYFVAAGENHWGVVAVPQRITFHELATEIFAATKDPALAQLAWGHGNVIRPRGTIVEESRFIVTEKRIPGSDLAYDFVEPEGGRLSLYYQLQLARDCNLLRRPATFNNFITYVSPLIRRAREDMLLEYVYALLAVLHRLPRKSQQLAYLEHQETYLNGAARAEWAALAEANIHTCLESGIPLYDVLLQARERIHGLMKSFFPLIMSGVIDLCPTLEHRHTAIEVASSLYLWSMNTARVFARDGQEVNMTYIKQINPLRAALRAAVEPNLILAHMESEYVEYAHLARLSDEALGLRPGLPSTLIRIGSEVCA